MVVACAVDCCVRNSLPVATVYLVKVKKFDIYLQTQRMKRASAYIPRNSIVADVGCRDGSLFEYLGDALGFGYGFDPYLDTVIEAERYVLNPCAFVPEKVSPDSLDCVTMLAVLEHLDAAAIDDVFKASVRALRTNGRIVITVPDARVDYILNALERFGIIEGQSLEEHHGYDVGLTRQIFERDGLFGLVAHKRFQFGLNNLFVFKKL